MTEINLNTNTLVDTLTSPTDQIKEQNVLSEQKVEQDIDQDEDDALHLFEILHNAVNGLEDTFADFYDEPTVEKFGEFEILIKEFITLVRELKNTTKSLLPKTERKKKNVIVDIPKEELSQTTEKDNTSEDSDSKKEEPIKPVKKVKPVKQVKQVKPIEPVKKSNPIPIKKINNKKTN